MDAARGIFKTAVDQLPEAGDWLSAKSGAIAPRVPEIMDLSKPLSVLNVVGLTAVMRHMQLSKQNKSLILPAGSATENISYVAEELSLDLVQAYSMRVAQTSIIRAAYEVSPRHAICLFANASREAAQLWEESVMSGDDSWSAKAGVAGKVFVIALTSTVFQQTMMWSFGSAFSVLRRTIADAQRGRIESKASDAKDRAARRRIEHKLEAHDASTQSWEDVRTACAAGAGRVVVISACTAAGAAAGTLVYPGAGTTTLAALGGVVGMFIS